MKWLMPWLILLLLAACKTSADDATPATEPPPTATVSGDFVPPNQAPDQGYPAPAVPTIAAGYPPPRPTATLSSAYQALEPVWLLKPAGAQCQEFEVDLEAAQMELTDAGVQVLAAEMALLPVCEACDVCASSQHYRVLVPTADLARAAELGWKPAE